MSFPLYRCCSSLNDMTTVSKQQTLTNQLFYFLEIVLIDFCRCPSMASHNLTAVAMTCCIFFFFFLKLFLSLDQAGLYMFPYALYVYDNMCSVHWYRKQNCAVHSFPFFQQLFSNRSSDSVALWSMWSRQSANNNNKNNTGKIPYEFYSECPFSPWSF